MIRVISPGTNPKEVLYKGTCTCGCIISYAKKDTKDNYDSRDGSGYDDLWIKCPTCGKAIEHNERNKLPKEEYNLGEPLKPEPRQDVNINIDKGTRSTRS